MHVTRWVLATLVTASVVLAAVSVSVRRGEGGGFPPPSSGGLLPFDSSLVGTPREIGMLSDANLDVVVDIATSGDSVFMLSRTSWRVVTGRRTHGPHGGQPVGAPEGMGRANRIVAADSTVYILGTERREVSRWSRDGRLIERLSIGSPSQPIVPQDLAVSSDGRVYVMVQEVQRTGVRWLLLTLAADQESVVLHRAAEDASMFTQPRIVAADAELLLFDPISHARTELFSGHSLPRPDAPVWPTPDSLRQQYNERLGRIGVGMGITAGLPDSLPSLQAAALTRTGIILTGANPVGEALHVEAFKRDGTPLGRLTEAPIDAPVFLTQDGVVRVVEEPRSITFTLLPINGN